MVDRLEELLEQAAGEDDEEQEDALALEAERVTPTAPAPRNEGKPESRSDAEDPKGTERVEREAASAQRGNGELGAAAPHTRGEPLSEDDWPASAHENRLTAPRVLKAGDDRAAEDAEAAPAPSTAAERGLEGLYRRTVQAGRPAAQSLPAEQAGQMRSAEKPGRAAALTVDELDRAVRRDSRRYDGGITIF